jgi:hypothetical protein
MIGAETLGSANGGSPCLPWRYFYPPGPTTVVSHNYRILENQTGR